MKVITGKYKGLKLKTLDRKVIRPTLTRIKEDSFNIIDNYFIFNNKQSLDLFGGSGALTIEGLSRGIKFATINDYSTDAIDVIKKNLYKTKSINWKIYQKDYIKLLKKLAAQNKKFDLVYLDPPFSKVKAYQIVFEQIINLNLLNNWAVVMIESKFLLASYIFAKYKLIKQKDYKNKHLYIVRLEQ